MQSAFLVGRSKMEIRETTIPAPGPGQALVAIKAVGVCGSDVHYYRDGKIGDQVVQYPFIIGHEAAGTVEETGPGSGRVKPGDQVAIEPATPCRECNPCRRGRPNLCPRVIFLGTPPVDGAFRQYMVMPEENLLRLPGNIEPGQAAFCEPLAVGLYAWEMARPAPGAAVAVFGCGPIGLSILICAAAAGARPLIALDPLGYRRDFALRKGATAALDPGDGNAPALIREATRGEGVEISFEAAGQPGALMDATAATAIGGQVVIAGIPTGDWTIPSHEARRSELTFRNVRRSAFTAEKAIEMVAAGMIDLEGVVSHRFPLDRTAEALELAADYRDGVIKAVIEPHSGTGG